MVANFGDEKNEQFACGKLFEYLIDESRVGAETLNEWKNWTCEHNKIEPVSAMIKWSDETSERNGQVNTTVETI